MSVSNNKDRKTIYLPVYQRNGKITLLAYLVGLVSPTLTGSGDPLLWSSGGGVTVLSWGGAKAESLLLLTNKGVSGRKKIRVIHTEKAGGGWRSFSCSLA